MKKHILFRYNKESAETKPKKAAISHPPTRFSERLSIKNFKLPFDKLPTECKLHVFSYLTAPEKGVAAQVCMEWRDLLSCSSAWEVVNMDDFTKCKSTQSSRSTAKMIHLTSQYSAYCKRVSQFMTYLASLHPSLRHLRFQFDIHVGWPQDSWLFFLLDLLREARCLRLSTVLMDWTVTPVRPQKLESYCCVFNKVCLMFHRHQARTQAFLKLLDRLGTVAPNLQTLDMPFPWTPRSVLLLSRLKYLEKLSLRKYLTLTGPDQELVDALLRSLVNLRYLHLQICMPIFHRCVVFQLTHKKLQVLEMTGSCGFFLKELQMPQLQVLKMARLKWGGPEVTQGSNKVPCLYGVLKKGTPSLQQINRCQLQEYWLEYAYDSLNAQLDAVCSCEKHYH